PALRLTPMVAASTSSYLAQGHPLAATGAIMANMSPTLSKPRLPFLRPASSHTTKRYRSFGRQPIPAAERSNSPPVVKGNPTLSFPLFFELSTLSTLNSQMPLLPFSPFTPSHLAD